jgi:hypothetical protein
MKLVVFINSNSTLTSLCTSQKCSEAQHFGLISKTEFVFGKLFKTLPGTKCYLGDRRTTVSIRDCGSRDGGSTPPGRPILFSRNNRLLNNSLLSDILREKKQWQTN